MIIQKRTAENAEAFNLPSVFQFNYTKKTTRWEDSLAAVQTDVDKRRIMREKEDCRLVHGPERACRRVAVTVRVRVLKIVTHVHKHALQ